MTQSKTLESFVSVIIPVYNAELTIERCIRSLKSQSYPKEKYEIIVVDDCSTDRTVELTKNSGADVVDSTRKNSGPGLARNIGVKHAKGNLLAFTDSDCEAKVDWIETIVKELQNNYALSGAVLNGNSHSKIAWAEYLLEFWATDKHYKRSFRSAFAGCNIACRKDVFISAGEFPNLPTGEDVLFASAIRKSGFKTLFVPELQIIHLCRTNLHDFLRNQKKLGRSRVLTTRIDPSLPKRFLRLGRWSIPIIFIGKIVKIGILSIGMKKTSKFFSSFPFIILGNISYCRGMWTEMNKPYCYKKQVSEK